MPASPLQGLFPAPTLTQGSGRFASSTLGCAASRLQRLKWLRPFTVHSVVSRLKRFSPAVDAHKPMQAHQSRRDGAA